MLLKRLFCTAASSALLLILSFSAFAEGGIIIQGTRVIYPQNARQQTISLRNSSKTDSFLVQSWAESADGKKTNDFQVIPPLYLSGPNNENIMRLIYTGAPLPADRESLYFFSVKAIPSMDKKTQDNKAVIMFATVTKIKLFVRPSGLKPSPEQAPAELHFKLKGDVLQVTNPTPYYITLVDLQAGKGKLNSIMVPPKGNAEANVKNFTGHKITYHNINDYGGVTPAINKSIEF
jgi:fimbrial chaperone protein